MLYGIKVVDVQFQGVLFSNGSRGVKDCCILCFMCFSGQRQLPVSINTCVYFVHEHIQAKAHALIQMKQFTLAPFGCITKR